MTNDYELERPLRRKKKKRFLLFLFKIVVPVFLLAGLFLFMQMFDLFKIKTSYSSVVSHFYGPTTEEKKVELSSEIQSIIDNNPGLEIGVAIKSFDSEDVQTFGVTEPFVAASTTKLITAVSYLHQVELGKYTLDTQIGGYSATWQLKQMINQSNNNSWELLNEKVGYSNVGKYANQIGLSSFDIEANTISATDQALFLEKLYKEELINHDNTALILSFAQKTNNEKLIPPGLPIGTVFYHKYGNLDNNLHDIAIIEGSKRTFSLVIFTNSDKPIDTISREKIFYELTQKIIELENL